MGNCLTCLKLPSAAPCTSTADADARKPDTCQVSACQQGTGDETTVSSVPSAHSRPQNHNEAGRQQHQNNGRWPVVEPYGSLSKFCQRRTLARSLSSTMGNLESKASDTKLHALFDMYRDPADDSILAEGMERLCGDLQVRPDEFRVLVLAWKLNAEQMCRFTRAEFVHGCKEMCVDSLRAIQTRLPEAVAEVEREPDLFKDLYRFTFRFGLDVATGQRILPVDMATCLWRLVFTVRTPPILSRWLHFLELHPQVRGIPRDTWNMFLNFSESVGDDLSSYDDTEAWPSLFDDFVEYENDHMNQNISKTKDNDGLLEVTCD